MYSLITNFYWPGKWSFGGNIPFMEGISLCCLNSTYPQTPPCTGDVGTPPAAYLPPPAPPYAWSLYCLNRGLDLCSQFSKITPLNTHDFWSKYRYRPSIIENTGIHVSLALWREDSLTYKCMIRGTNCEEFNSVCNRSTPVYVSRGLGTYFLCFLMPLWWF